MPNPKKPTKLKVIHGTYRDDRAPQNEPEPTPVLELPHPPTVMPKYGKKMWRTLGPELIDKGLLTEADLQTFEICCFNYGLYRGCAEIVFKRIKDRKTKNMRRRTLEEYMKGKNSQTMPEYISMTKAFSTHKSYLAEFGLSPAARSRIDLLELEDADEEMAKMERMWYER